MDSARHVIVTAPFVDLEWHSAMASFEPRAFELVVVRTRGKGKGRHKMVAYLNGEINPQRCGSELKVKDDKVVVKLVKASPGKWSSFEELGPAGEPPVPKYTKMTKRDYQRYQKEDDTVV